MYLDVHSDSSDFYPYLSEFTSLATNLFQETSVFPRLMQQSYTDLCAYLFSTMAK